MPCPRPVSVISVVLVGILAAAFARPAFGQCEMAKLTASDARASQDVGTSASLDGDVAVLGARELPGGTGLAYVYRWNGSDWVEEQKLNASDAASWDHFGISVSINEDVIVVGARDEHPDFIQEAGAAYVFRFDGSAWVEEAKLTASDAAEGNFFGGAVVVRGDVIAVGADRDVCAAGEACGAAYVYRFNGSVWTEEARLTAADAAEKDYFGGSLAISGDVLAVSATGSD